jgi:hypothetical protein
MLVMSVTTVSVSSRVRRLRPSGSASSYSSWRHFVVAPFDEQPLVAVAEDLVVEVAGGDDAVHMANLERRQRAQRQPQPRRVEMLTPGCALGSPAPGCFGQGIGRVDKLGAEVETAVFDQQRRQGVDRLGGGGQRGQGLLTGRQFNQALHGRLVYADGLLPPQAEEGDLLEYLILAVGEAVDLHLLVPGEDVAHRLAQPQQVLGHDPDEQAARLQPGAAVPEPLVL